MNWSRGWHRGSGPRRSSTITCQADIIALLARIDTEVRQGTFIGIDPNDVWIEGMREDYRPEPVERRTPAAQALSDIRHDLLRLHEAILLTRALLAADRALAGARPADAAA
jgi:hypothetical protein